MRNRNQSRLSHHVSRALGGLVFFTKSSHRLLKLFSCLLIGCSVNLSFGFTKSSLMLSEQLFSPSLLNLPEKKKPLLTFFFRNSKCTLTLSRFGLIKDWQGESIVVSPSRGLTSTVCGLLMLIVTTLD